MLGSFSKSRILVAAKADPHPHPLCAAGLLNAQDPNRYAKARECHAGRTEVADVRIRWEPVALRIIEDGVSL